MGFFIKSTKTSSQCRASSDLSVKPKENGSLQAECLFEKLGTTVKPSNYHLVKLSMNVEKHQTLSDICMMLTDVNVAVHYTQVRQGVAGDVSTWYQSDDYVETIFLVKLLIVSEKVQSENANHDFGDLVFLVLANNKPRNCCWLMFCRSTVSKISCTFQSFSPQEFRLCYSSKGSRHAKNNCFY